MADQQPSALERLRQLEAAKQAEARAQAEAAAAAASANGLTAAEPNKRGPVVGGLVAAGLLAWKLKSLLFLAKFAKFATTGFSMLLMAVVYARFYGAGFAFSLVFLILIHELGHGFAAGRVGLAVGAPVFIPFFGAFIALKEKPKSTWQDFVIGAGGPIAGSLGAAVFIAASFFVTGKTSGLLLAVGYFALMMNLFNLIPFWSLDGARMMGPVPLNFALAGSAVLVVAIIIGSFRATHLNPFALGVAAVCAWKAGSRWWEGRQQKKRTPLAQLQSIDAARRAVSDDGVTADQRKIAATVYFGLAAILIVALHELPRWLPELER